MKHTCHAIGCEVPCPPAMLMCRAHWAKVPTAIQREVYRTVKIRGPRVDRTWAPWWRAQTAALHFVAVLEGRTEGERGRPLQAWLAHENDFVTKLEAIT